MRVHLTLEGRLQEPLRQLLQQSTLTQQRHTLTAGLLSQGGHRVVVEHPAQQILRAHRRRWCIDLDLSQLARYGCHQITPLS